VPPVSLQQATRHPVTCHHLNNTQQSSNKVIIKGIYREYCLKNKETPHSTRTPRSIDSCRLYVIRHKALPWTFSTPEFAEDVGEQHHASLVQHTDTRHRPERHEQRIARCDVQPDREECHSEEVVKEDHGLPDDARQKSYRSIDALSASLEVAEAPLLKSSELGVCIMSVIFICTAAT
jgi:hypothetical protein